MDSQQHIGTGGIGHEVKNTHVLRHFDHDRPRILEANKLGFAIIGKIGGANNCPFQMADLRMPSSNRSFTLPNPPLIALLQFDVIIVPLNHFFKLKVRIGMYD
jgi:hypothetical protein